MLKADDVRTLVDDVMDDDVIAKTDDVRTFGMMSSVQRKKDRHSSSQQDMFVWMSSHTQFMWLSSLSLCRYLY